MFWGLVRFAGIIVGVATLLRLATTEGLVTYDAVFQAWLDWLQWFLDIGLDRIEPTLKWAIEWVRSFGVPFPDLQPEWRPTFILTGLLLGASARHSGLGVGATVAAGAAVIVFAAVAGFTGEPGSFAIAASAAAYSPAAARWGMQDTEREGVNLPPAFANAFLTFLLFFPVAAAIAHAILTFFLISLHDLVGYARPIFPVSAAAAIMAVVATLMGIAGVGRSWRQNEPVLREPFVNISLDILGAMGTALALAVMFADPPLF